tara:strand:+ start:7949 stop:11413 length:3465 start_codon:yes stop_codon:yes gene_type:complete
MEINYKYKSDELYSQLNDNDLYPLVDDNKFNLKISNKKEFNDAYNKKVENTKNILDIKDSEKQIFTLKSHQVFVKNFMSRYTPYKSLLLYHGLGTGKTCSAIGIAFEKIKYMIALNERRKIIIICSPNIRENFKKQIFNEDKLNDYNLGLFNTCVGEDLMNIVNPVNNIYDKNKLKEKVNSFIDEWFIFMGYKGFSNAIKKSINNNTLLDDFDNRLVIIDEIHNVRSENEDEKDKIILNNLQKLIEESKNIKLLLLSATPMFNNYSEIIWLINLINLNDNRPIINHNDIFDENGNFKIDINTGEEIGKKKFIKKITGYVSFVEGNSPFTFPFRIYPNQFKKENSILNKPYPRNNWEGLPINKNKNLIDYYCVEMSEDSLQRKIYLEFIKYINNGNIKYNFANMKNLSILNLLNIIYPSDKLDKISDFSNESKQNIQYIINNNTGKNGLKNIFNIQSLPFKLKNEKWKDTFKLSNLEKYSAKIFDVCNNIKKTKEGVSLIYSEKIYSGIIPMALALEEMGYSRLDRKDNLLSNNKKSGLKYIVITGNKLLSKNNKLEIDKVVQKENKNGKNIQVVLISLAGSEGIDFKYIRNAFIIDPWYNMNRIEQIIGRCIREGSHSLLPFEKRNCCIYLYATYIDNINETIDMKLYRTAEDKEKTIGKITRVIKENAVDCLLYSKEKIIYNDGDILTNISNDFIFYKNEENTFNVNDKIKTYYDNGNKLFPAKIINIHENGLIDVKFDAKIVNLKLANDIYIQYMINKKPFSNECDYMETCNYKCSFIDDNNNISFYQNTDDNINMNTFTINNNLIDMNTLKNVIIDLFSEKYFYTKNEIINRVNFLGRTYTIEYIELALDMLLQNKLNIILDRYNRKGNLIKIGDLYLFQPIEINNQHINIFDRSYPILDKNKDISIIGDKKYKKKVSNTDENHYDNFVRNVESKYKNISSIMEILFKENNDLKKHYNTDYFQRIIIQMLFDKLDKKEKLNILNYNHNNIINDILADLIIQVNNEQIIIIDYNDDEKLTIVHYIDSTWQTVDDNNYYIDKLKEMFSNKKDIKSKPYYGIFTVNNKEKKVFKIKSDKKSGDKGENCNTIKSEFNSIFEALLNIKYDTISHLIKSSKDNLCFVIEFLLRYKNFTDKSTTWFIPLHTFCLNKVL